MQQLNPQSFPMRPPTMGMPPGMGGPNQAIMPPFGPTSFPNMRNPVTPYPNEQDQKRKQFARGIFVSGFEKSVTTAMIQKHFSIKPINGLKHPMTKFKESKGFAFIYYGSEDDALYVKKTLDRTAILRDKVRITRTVISENLSKMMFKLKTQGFTEKEIQQNETKYFNDENLEKQVERIIKPLFNDTVEVNKITIPRTKSDKKPLRYARVFFYVSDVKQAKTIADMTIKNSDNAFYDTTGKNEYEIILNCISHKINTDDIFGRYAKSEIYEYTKKNQSNVLHMKGVKANPNEDATVLADELKEFMQKQGPQWNIVNAYAAVHETRGAWANLTFSSYEETIQAYEHLKTLRPKFRECVLYGSLRNVKDPRTVVISTVRPEIQEKDVEKFLNELASKSVKTQIAGEDEVRRYDYFSFNIIESKRFFKVDGDETKGVTESEKDTIHPSWIQVNEVPRRLIIHFFHEFSDEEIKELNNDITVTPGYGNIFMKDNKNRPLRSNHQKGHVNKDGVYIKHTEMKGKRKVKPPRAEKPMRRPMDPNQRNFGGGLRPNISRPNVDFSLGAPGNRQAPRIPSNLNLQGQGGYKPAPVGGVSGIGSVPPPSMSNPPMRPPFNQGPQGFGLPPSNMPPMPNTGFKSGYPTGNLPPRGMPPPPQGMGTVPPPQGMGNIPPQGMGSLPPQSRPPGPYPSNFPGSQPQPPK